MSAAIYGYVSSTAVLGLAIASEVQRDHMVTSISIGAAATAIHLISVPITAAGDASGRRSGAAGISGLRIAAWIFYGATAAEAVALIGLGAAQVQPPQGLIASTGLCGFASGILMAADASYVHAQAIERPRMAAAGVRWAPGIAAVRGGGVVGATVQF
jgi:hypothetical protein